MMQKPLIPLAAAALLLSACAEDAAPPPVVQAPPPPPTMDAPEATWMITDIYSPGKLGHGAVGQRIRLTRALAEDAQGRTCTTPVYTPLSATMAEYLGRAADAAWTHPVSGFAVHCGTAPFGTYIQGRDGSYLSHQAGAIMRLAMAPATQPLPLIPFTMAPVDNHPAPAAANAAEKKTNRAYLASYQNQVSAQHGWSMLIKAHPHLAQAQADYQPVDLGKKGKFVRLFAKTSGDTAALCKPLKKSMPECGATWMNK